MLVRPSRGVDPTKSYTPNTVYSHGVDTQQATLRWIEKSASVEAETDSYWFECTPTGSSPEDWRIRVFEFDPPRQPGELPSPSPAYREVWQGNVVTGRGSATSAAQLWATRHTPPQWWAEFSTYHQPKLTITEHAAQGGVRYVSVATIQGDRADAMAEIVRQGWTPTGGLQAVDPKFHVVRVSPPASVDEGRIPCRMPGCRCRGLVSAVSSPGRPAGQN